MLARIPSFLLTVLLLPPVPAMAAVKVWQATITLPTYDEGRPDENPPFPLFQTDGHPSYPYTLRKGFTTKLVKQTWRTLEMENEYLKCIVLPDLGGRIYSCYDKPGRREMFYSNAVIKKSDIGIRGAWAAAGTEFNFPVGHSWVTVSPVDFAIRQNPDGSASIFVGSTDRADRLRWLAEMVLRPASSVLEQHVTLSNPGPVRRRYYWWNNASIRASEDTRFVIPCHLTAAHSQADLEQWPVNAAGVDMSALANHKNGGVARFAAGCRESFMGVYSKLDGGGTAHYADPVDVPGKKLWSWGVDRTGLEAMKRLTDDGSQYVELQAGLFENQETYAFLEPRQISRFIEYWMPVRALGGISRVNRNGAVYLRRTSGDLEVSLNTYRPIGKAMVRISRGDQVLIEETVALDPQQIWKRSIPKLKPDGVYRFELFDEQGKVLLAHTENLYEALPVISKSPVKGPSDSEIGRQAESEGNLLLASKEYKDSLSAGRVSLALNRFDDAVRQLSSAPATPEQQLYLGVALAYSGDDAKARGELKLPHGDRLFGFPARIELAKLTARAGDRQGALRDLQDAVKAKPDLAGAGAIEVALLRSLNRKDEAAQSLAHWTAMDPADSLLRHEGVKLGTPDEALWHHLAADPERVLDLATVYLQLGMFDDALDLLARQYPSVSPLQTEPGAVLPQDYPLIAYYRGYCRMRMGQSGKSDFELAAKQSTMYVFPNRPESFVVLKAAIHENASDANAEYLLGALYLAGGMVDPAVQAWQRSVQLHGNAPALHASLGRVLRDLKKDSAALKVFAAGIQVDPGNRNLQDAVRKGLDDQRAEMSAKTKSGFFVEHTAAPPASPEEFASLALDMLLAGRTSEAAAVFTEQNFPKEKQSESVREAFIEVRLQAIRDSARAKRCTEAIASIETLGDESAAVPFSLYGFAGILKSARVQYELGLVESICGEEKAARKRWTKAAKAAGRQDPLDFAYTQLAGMKLGSKATSNPAQPYAKGLIEKASGLNKEAEVDFRKALTLAQGDIMLRYLCQRALLDN